MLQNLKNIFHLLEAISGAIFYRFPSKKLIVIGVTGTDGKTTTSFLIHQILILAGYKTAILSTLSSAHTTTPGRWAVQKFLRRSLENGCTHAVLEVTSIGIDQHRVWGVDFALGVLTNLANHEHLDYHKTFENYKNTKLRFLEICKQKVFGPDLQKANFKKILAVNKLPGQYNNQNIMTAATATRLLGVTDDVIIKAVASFKLPSGRFQIVHKKPIVIVDFAHTPQAFAAILPEAKKLGKRLIHVFGATGDRDKSKRPVMGKIASQFDHVIILTSEDTYCEDLSAIIAQIESGVTIEHLVIPDRREAIKKALDMAQPEDVVLLTGIGHQRSMNIGGQEVPWNEPKIVREVLKDVNKK